MYWQTGQRRHGEGMRGVNSNNMEWKKAKKRRDGERDGKYEGGGGGNNNIQKGAWKNGRGMQGEEIFRNRKERKMVNA